MLSALQSAVFNRALELRAAGRRPAAAGAPGDVLQKAATGGLFASTDPAVDQPRVDAGELAPTGPLPGGRENEPPPEHARPRPGGRGDRGRSGRTREDFARAGRDLPGARRPFCSG